MKKSMLAAGLALVLPVALAATPALARHCPMDMKKIDAALSKNPSLSADQLAQVKQLRAEGETLHKAGNHPASEDTLAQAMKILGIQ